MHKVMDREKIALNYRQTFFVLDAMASLPTVRNLDIVTLLISQLWRAGPYPTPFGASSSDDESS
jgi:hypothetical protein